MIIKRVIQLKISLFLIVVLLGVTGSIALKQAYAASESEKLADKYLNAKCKYLYLGVEGKDEFIFSIKKELQKEVAACHWYIENDKGNPKAVSINAITGLVKAKNIGTAYIICKITLKNKTVILPEAEINVINNATKVKISNLPVNLTVMSDNSLDFDAKIVNTKAGKGEVSSDIIRWEIADDTAGVGSVTDDGVVYIANPGEFRIRAICFERIDTYKAWLINKNNASYVTAASEWAHIKVISPVGEASTQEQLDKLLDNLQVTRITVSTQEKLNFTIHRGDFLRKTLIVNAPNSNIVNAGSFKKIVINSPSLSTWEEDTDNNIIEIYGGSLTMNVTKYAHINSIELKSADIKSLSINKNTRIESFTADWDNNQQETLIINTEGLIRLISLSSGNPNLTIKGRGTINTLNVNSIVKKAIIDLSTHADSLEVNADTNVQLREGSEETLIKLMKKECNIEVSNLNYDKIIIETPKGNVNLYAKQSKNTEELFRSIDLNMGISNRLLPKIALITASDIYYGEPLSASSLTGYFLDLYDIVLEGTLTWETPDLTVYTTGEYIWTFKPKRKYEYATLRGVAKVNVLQRLK